VSIGAMAGGGVSVGCAHENAKNMRDGWARHYQMSKH
jgi:hypothetical protein